MGRFRRLARTLSRGLARVFARPTESAPVAVSANSWKAHEPGGESEATWDDYSTTGGSPTTWADLT
jgi:hypothetical protein